MGSYNKQLKDFPLYYEELEKKVGPKKRVKAMADVKDQATTAKPLKENDTLSSSVEYKPKKSVANVTKIPQKALQSQKFRAILGIGLLFVVVSITYSSYVIYSGVDSSASRLMLIPQVAFALFTLFKAFSKIYK